MHWLQWGRWRESTDSWSKKFFCRQKLRHNKHKDQGLWPLENRSWLRTNREELLHLRHLTGECTPEEFLAGRNSIWGGRDEKETPSPKFFDDCEKRKKFRTSTKKNFRNCWDQAVLERGLMSPCFRFSGFLGTWWPSMVWVYAGVLCMDCTWNTAMKPRRPPSTWRPSVKWCTPPSPTWKPGDLEKETTPSNVVTLFLSKLEIWLQ